MVAVVGAVVDYLRAGGAAVVVDEDVARMIVNNHPLKLVSSAYFSRLVRALTVVSWKQIVGIVAVGGIKGHREVEQVVLQVRQAESGK